MNPIAQSKNNEGADEIDRQIIVATQKGLPLVAEPYDEIANQLGISSTQVKDRITAMQERGIIRRVGIVPNHYRLGYVANGMSVWDIDDDKIDEMGERIGALDYVTHCYKRPRHLPLWPYNLFAMVHAKTRQEVEDKVAAIASILANVDRGHDIIYSTKILKKTGLRLCSPKKAKNNV